eukprot:7588434-Alexandrium_andersonii.AAC.1
MMQPIQTCGTKPSYTGWRQLSRVLSLCKRVAQWIPTRTQQRTLAGPTRVAWKTPAPRALMACC